MDGRTCGRKSEAMTIFDAIRDRVTAREAAQVYGLQFGRNGRALCPWHDDRHPDLAFYGNHCYCHACHEGGDAVALTAQVFGLSMIEAARKINADFRLDLTDDNMPDDQPRVNRAEEQRKAKAEFQQRWNFLCDVVHEADEQLEHMKGGWESPMFITVLAARARADDELNMMWEDICDARRA